ncbi:hypothetical protein ACJJTC_011692 [Scirpophaga incertulas]
MSMTSSVAASSFRPKALRRLREVGVKKVFHSHPRPRFPRVARLRTLSAVDEVGETIGRSGGRTRSDYNGIRSDPPCQRRQAVSGLPGEKWTTEACGVGCTCVWCEAKTGEVSTEATAGPSGGTTAPSREKVPMVILEDIGNLSDSSTCSVTVIGSAPLTTRGQSRLRPRKILVSYKTPREVASPKHQGVAPKNKERKQDYALLRTRENATTTTGVPSPKAGPLRRPQLLSTVPRLLSVAEATKAGPSASQLRESICNELAAILKVSRTSQNLKGTFQKVLKDAVETIARSTGSLAQLTVSDENAKLEAENKRRRADVAEFRKETAELRVEVAKLRAAMTAPAPVAALDERELIREIMSQTGTLINARFEGLEERLLPAPRYRPPLAADHPQDPAADRARTAGPSTRNKKADRPILSSSSGSGTTPGTLAEVAETADKRSKSRPDMATASAKKKKPAQKPTAELNSALSTEKDKSPVDEEGWQVVSKRKRKTSKATREVEQPKPATKKSAKKPPKKRGRKRRNLRVPNTMAVVFTLPPELQDGKKPLFADLFKTCRGAVDLGEIGLEGGVKFRETATGARLMELPKGTSSDKADLLVSKLKQSLPQEVRITRPVKCADVRISYLDDSITKEDISDAIAKKGGCSLSILELAKSALAPLVWARCGRGAPSPLRRHSRREDC